MPQNELEDLVWKDKGTTSIGTCLCLLCLDNATTKIMPGSTPIVSEAYSTYYFCSLKSLKEKGYVKLAWDPIHNEENTGQCQRSESKSQEIRRVKPGKQDCKCSVSRHML